MNTLIEKIDLARLDEEQMLDLHAGISLVETVNTNTRGKCNAINTGSVCNVINAADKCSTINTSSKCNAINSYDTCGVINNFMNCNTKK